MKCTDETKKAILAKVVNFVKLHERSGLSGPELQLKMNPFVLQLFQEYGMDCVREVLRTLYSGTEGPLN